MTGGHQRPLRSIRVALAAGLLAGGAALMPAAAADLGGNCCADLEERVAELEATTVRKGNRKVSLTISGQVTTAILAWNDGNSTRSDDVYVVDNEAGGGTYFSLTGSAKISPSLSAGFQIAIAIDSGGRSHQVSQIDDDGSDGHGKRGRGGFDTDIVLTLANWYVDHSHFGRLTVGRINTATSGITTIDLGGAGVIANANIGYWNRGFFLALDDDLLVGNATWGQVLGGSTVNASGLSRANAVSYTSPNYGGFSLSAAAGEDDVWDVALRYAGEWHGFRMAAGVGYIHNSSGFGDVTEEFAGPGRRPSQWKGSASILHVKTGLFLTGAYVRQDNDEQYHDRPDTTLWYLQGGIAKNWTALGNTVLYGEYARVDDGISGDWWSYGNKNVEALEMKVRNYDLITGSEATMWGLGIVQHIDAAAMEVFLAYRRYSAEVTSPASQYGYIYGTEGLNDFDVVMSGARIRF